MSPAPPKTLSTVRAFDGVLHRFQHDSGVLKSSTVFSVYVPDTDDQQLPVIYYLSGLTCTDENCAQKGCAFGPLRERGVAMVFPDTSPRGEGTPDDAAYDMGQGAGFYVDATEGVWAERFQMYSYIVDELPETLKACGLPLNLNACSITGHSMGGHGALTIALRNPGRFASVSAFAPIANPTAEDCPWGQKTLGAYLGSASSDKAKLHDATELVKSCEGFSAPILIDQGASDNFYKTQLHPERFVDAAKAKGLDVTYRLHEGYDHSYFFVSTFMRDHIEFHARALKK